MDNWLSSEQIEKALEDRDHLRSLVDLYALNRFFKSAYYAEEYQVTEEWTSLITLSAHGTAIRRVLENDIGPLDDSLCKFLLFYLFTTRDVLIDEHRSDKKGILRCLNQGISNGQLRFPHRFGRALYDKFNDQYLGNRTTHLPPEEVEGLLRGEECGIYQVGNLLSGPLGILNSEEGRYAPPNLSLPLWHCSDTGCSALHSVQLLPHESAWLQHLKTICDCLDRRIGPPSEWHNPLRRRFRTHTGPCRYYDLPAFVCDALVDEETTALIKHALRTATRKSLSDTLRTAGYHKNPDRESPDSLTEALTPLERRQLLLTLGDSSLIRLIDELTLRKEIVVPASEKRVTRQRPPKIFSGDTRTEISQLGTRSTRGNPMANLAANVYAAYQQAGKSDDLDWKLRNRPGSGVRTALVKYIEERRPTTVVKELILSDQSIWNHFVKNGIDHSTTENIDHDAERIAWKLGFDLPSFTDKYSRLKARLESFIDLVRSLDPISGEDGRETVRAIGVNLFVSVEEYLEELIGYNVWLLAEDHFGKTRFKYNYDEVIQKVPEILGEAIHSGPITFRWSVSGENTLGTLLVYCDELLRWASKLPTLDRNDYFRPNEELPHYAEETHREFIYQHTALWADSSPDELRLHISHLGTVIEQIRKADAASMRNGIDHKRTGNSFPTASSLQSCANRLREAIKLSETHRIFPVEFWGRSVEKDYRGFVAFNLEDANGTELKLYGPATIRPEPTFQLDRPLIVAPGNLLGIPNTEVIFRKQEKSLYSRYWKGYPRRRKIPLQATDISSDEG